MKSITANADSDAALRADLTIDMTTTGRRSGGSQRIEIWFFTWTAASMFEEDVARWYREQTALDDLVDNAPVVEVFFSDDLDQA